MLRALPSTGMFEQVQRVRASAGLAVSGLACRTPVHLMIVLLAALGSAAQATAPNAAEQPIERFLATDGDRSHPYRALRRLEAENGDRKGWLQAATAYAPGAGFTYKITSEGGSSQIRTQVLKAVLDAEREAIAQGEAARSALAPNNYLFEPNGIDAEGFANVLLTPRRKERTLIAGVMFLRPDAGELVRVQGRLARNPSFWVKNVDVVRRYSRINGVVVPIALESTAQVRFLGPATFQMTYDYEEIDGRSVR